MDNKLKCGNCMHNKKDLLLQCGHIVCTPCFEKMKFDRKKECENVKGKKKREMEEKKLKCPLSVCGKSINNVAHTFIFDV